MGGALLWHERGVEKGSPDMFQPTWLINRLLYMVLWLETNLLNFLSFPFGVGLFAIARKPID